MTLHVMLGIATICPASVPSSGLSDLSHRSIVWENLRRINNNSVLFIQEILYRGSHALLLFPFDRDTDFCI